jgi:hypothetical protein
VLQFDLTNRHAGIVLWGDRWSLRAVHDLVHKVNEESPRPEQRRLSLGACLRRPQGMRAIVETMTAIIRQAWHERDAKQA